MKNAADLLADLFDSWTIPQRSNARNVRSGSQENLGLWDVHRLAIGYLMQVERDIDALEATGRTVAHYREALPAWYRAMFSFDQEWRQVASAESPVTDAGNVRLLRALAEHVYDLRLSPRLAPQQIEEIRTAIEEAQALISDAGEAVLSDGVKRYLLGLVFEARKVAEEVELFGPAALRSTTLELSGAMGSVAGSIQNPEERKTWGQKITKLAAVWAAVIPAVAIESGVSTLVQRAIGG